jgi:DNA helicase II / ATP-dependent DNA helicase PcrA
MSLTAEQLEVVNADKGVWVVVACPGAGKTRTIVERFKRLVMSGVSTSDILSLTFTNEAAQEMAKRSGVLDNKCFRTFHSFCLNLLQAERKEVPFEMCDTIIPVEQQNYDLLFRLVKQYPRIRNWKDLQSKISLWKQTGVSPERALEDAFDADYFMALAYQDYERMSREEGWLDFDSLQQEAKNLLETNDAVRERWQFRFVQCDEGQDCDTSQFRILQLVSEKHQNVLIVGDENQLIYAWRGAQENNLTNFSQRFPGAQKLYLSINFRSTQKLVKFLREILPVDNGLASKMESARGEGIDPMIIRFWDDREEADTILTRIAASGDPVNTAVITRTNRQLYLFENICVSRGIKYKILGKRDFFDLPEVSKLLELAKKHADEFVNVPPVEALETLIARHNLLRIYKASEDPMEAPPAENLNDICKMAAKHENVGAFLIHLRKLTHARKSHKGLTLCTAHQAKGKEYKVVYLVGANQGVIPHAKGDLAEEKRIFFVGSSRAADALNISFFREPSMFLSAHREWIQVHTNEASNE